MTERLEGLYSSYGHQCGCGGDSSSTGAQIARLAKSGDKDKHTPPEPRPSVSKKAYRWVYKAGGMTPEMLSDRPIRKMIEETSSSLSTALDEDIAQELTPEMRNALEQDVFLFSGFKTYHNLKEASLLLENKERGGIRTFDEFYRSIRQIDDKYNRDWLRSEYQFAVNSAAMAAQWEQALKDKDLYALQYVTVGDDRVRPEHAELDGMVLPMDDPFWRTGTPPNGWGCRCTVMQVPLEENPLTPQEQSDRSRAASAALNDMTEGKNSIFRFNPYYDQALFPPKHPYFGKKGYRHCSSDRFAHADGDADPCNIYRKLKDTAEEKLYVPKKKVIERTKEGHVIEQYDNVDPKASDYHGVLMVARYFARTSNVTVMPRSMRGKFEFAYEQLFGELIGTPYEGKTPDLKTVFGFVEVKGYRPGTPGKNALRNMLSDAITQSNKFVLQRHPDWTENFVLKSIENRVRKGKDIQMVWLLEENGDLTPIYKKTEG